MGGGHLSRPDFGMPQPDPDHPLTEAAMCVRHYAAKGYGVGRIRSELYRRGIPRELWDDALQELPEQDDQIDTLLRRRLRSDTPDRDELRRASDYLYRRGFGRDEIRAAIARYQDNFEEY